jgi:hypothetical protein
MARTTARGFPADGSRRNQTHLPDDREGAALLGGLLLGAALTLTTTPLVTALLALVPLTVAFARSAGR